MFTGIIQDVGRINQCAPAAAGRRLTVGTALDTATFELGESVAVNGVCLTVTALAPSSFDADVSSETLRRSTLGELRSGSAVNLERALRPNDRLGGHFVLGHVDGTVRLVKNATEGEFRVLRFETAAPLLRYVVEKGSVALDGISLTVSSLDAGGFSVAVIPHTLEHTNLPSRRPGDRINLEADILGKYVERLLEGKPGGDGITWETLARSGFVR